MHLTSGQGDVEAWSVRRAAMPRKNYHLLVFARPQSHVLCSSWFESLPRPPLTTCQNIPFKDHCAVHWPFRTSSAGPPFLDHTTNSRSIASRISLTISAQTICPCHRRKLTTDLNGSLSLRSTLALPSVASPTSPWYREKCRWFKVLPSRPLL